MSDECPTCKLPAWPTKSGRGPQEGECDEMNGEVCLLRDQLATITAESDRYRTALEAIEGYDIDWTKGTGENVSAVAEIAREALADTSPPAQPARPLAGKVARHLEDLEEPLQQPGSTERGGAK